MTEPSDAGTLVDEAVLAEMREYYRARAGEYDDWFNRRGRYDRGPQATARWFAEVEEVAAALDELRLDGDVLELAPGTGIWTERLAARARSVTAVDASPEMIELNKARVGGANVEYVIADLFDWRPDRRYDAVAFAFWISHVPLERLDAFLATVASALRPGGAVFFVDGRREPLSTAVDHQLPEAPEQVMTRRLDDGRTFQIVKNFLDPRPLRGRFLRAGLDVDVRETATYFLYGVGRRRADG